MGDDMEEINKDEGLTLQLCFLKLEIDQQELEQLGDYRHVSRHCKDYVNIRDDSIMAKFIK